MPAKRILLADDSLTAMLVHRMLLADQGYDLLEARDGQEAVEIATVAQPDLILMDVVMPRKTGFEAVRILRSQEATKSIPVIMLTTRSEPNIIEVCFRCGCNDYITKPVNGSELLTKVRTLLAS